MNNMKTSIRCAVIASAVVLASCSSDSPTPESGAPPVDRGATVEAPRADPVALADAGETVDEPAQTEPADSPETVEVEPEEVVVAEPEVIETRILEWELGDQGELRATVAANNPCADVEGRCTDDAVGVFTVIAPEGYSTFRLPIAIGVDAVEIVEVSDAEFLAYLTGGVHPAVVEASADDVFLMRLDSLHDDDSIGSGANRIASEIVLLGA